MTLNYVELGNDDNPTLIMIHGAGGSSATWYLQLKGLSQHLHCVAIDLNGHGDSPDRKQNDTLQSYLEDIESVYSQFDQPILMGHSMGAALTQLTALSNPENLGGIVLVSTGAKLRVLPAIFDLLENEFETYVELVGEYMFHKSADKRMIEASRKEVTKCHPKIISRDFELCDNYDIMNKVHTISTPTLVIVGQDDVMTPVKYSQYLHEMIPNSELSILPNAGHSVMLEQSAEFNKIVLEWVNGLA